MPFSVADVQRTSVALPVVNEGGVANVVKVFSAP
jgi:hypothetical protein